MDDPARPSDVAAAVRRAVERSRPWAAPPTSGAPRVAVVGAGPTGLATAAVLGRLGVATVVLDAHDRPGGSWPDRYDHLRLNTVRWMSDLPGWRLQPRHGGRWLTRDQYVAYLREYAAHHSLGVQGGVEVTALHGAGPGTATRGASSTWRLTTSAGDLEVEAVVVATGRARAPRRPRWEGEDGFAGVVVHSSRYRHPAALAGQRVVVVGGGSSGAEIALDLVDHAASVTLSVRTAPQVFPREAGGIPLTPLAPPADHLPTALVDAAGSRLEAVLYGSRDYLPEPTAGMATLLAEGKEPIVADELPRAVRAGRLRVVGALEALDGPHVRCADGSTVRCDAVIAATGFDPGLDGLLGPHGVLDHRGLPRPERMPPGLAVAGFRIPFAGSLWGIGQDAVSTARALASTLRPRRPRW